MLCANLESGSLSNIFDRLCPRLQLSRVVAQVLGSFVTWQLPGEPSDMRSPFAQLIRTLGLATVTRHVVDHWGTPSSGFGGQPDCKDANDPVNGT